MSSNLVASPVVYPGHTPEQRYAWLMSVLTRKEENEMIARRELRTQARTIAIRRSLAAA